MRPLATLALVAAVLAGSTAAWAADRASTKEAELMVHKAVAFLQQNGKEKALAAFSDPQGIFAYRDLYITAYDLDGKCVAHGQKKDRVGKNLLADKDADGKAFVAERIQLAKEKGKGWQEYKFMNPATKQVEQKVAYFEKAGDVVISCGAYRK